MLARHWYAEMLGLIGRDDDAEVQFRRARELDPLSVAVRVDFARMLTRRGRLQESLQLVDLEIQLVRGRSRCFAATERGAFGGGEVGDQARRDALGQGVFDGEDIGKRLIEASSPHLAAIRSARQLRSATQLVTIALDGSGQHGIDAKTRSGAVKRVTTSDCTVSAAGAGTVGRSQYIAPTMVRRMTTRAAAHRYVVLRGGAGGAGGITSTAGGIGAMSSSRMAATTR